MAHLNLYIPDDIAAGLKREASRARVPLSRYVSSLLSTHRPEADWPPEYMNRVCGFLSEEMSEPEDAPPEFVEDLDQPR